MQFHEKWKARQWAKKTPEQRQRALMDNALRDPEPRTQLTPPVEPPIGLLYQKAELLDPEKNPEAYDTRLRPDLSDEAQTISSRASRKIAMDRAAAQAEKVTGLKPVFSHTEPRDIREIG